MKVPAAAVTTLLLLNVLLSATLTSASATNDNWDSYTDATDCKTFSPEENTYARLPYPAVTHHQRQGDDHDEVVVMVEVELVHLLPPPPPSEWRLDLPFYHSGTVIGWALFSTDPGPKKVLHWLGFRCWNDQPVMGPVQWAVSTSTSTSSTLRKAFPDHWSSTSILRNFTLQIRPTSLRVLEAVEGDGTRKLLAEHNCSQAFPSFPPDDMQVHCYGNCGHLQQCRRAPVTQDPLPDTEEQRLTGKPPAPTEALSPVTAAAAAAASTSQASPSSIINTTTVVWVVMLVLVVSGLARRTI